MQLLLSRPVLACFAVFAISSVALTGFQNYSIPVFDRLHHMSLVLAGSALTAYLLGGAVGYILGGFVARLAKDLEAGMQQLVISQRLSDLGSELALMPPAEFGKFIAAEENKWREVVKAAKIPLQDFWIVAHEPCHRPPPPLDSAVLLGCQRPLHGLRVGFGKGEGERG